MALEKELAVYKQKLSELAADEGKYVLIQGDKLISVYDTYADALKEGYEKFGLEAFLVKKIEAVEQVQYITRNILFSCPS